MLEVKARSKHHFRALFHDSDLECEGYVPKSALGDVYEPREPVLGALELEADSTLLVAPGGRPLACIPAASVRLVSELGRDGDFSLVEYTSSHLRLVGWVRSARVHSATAAGSVKLADLGRYGHGGGDAPRVGLRRGAPIYDARGRQVGLVIRATELPLVSRGDERSELELNLPPWGRLHVWVSRADLASQSELPAEVDAGTE